MARLIALAALVALGLSDAPFYEPALQAGPVYGVAG
jgi:hypothetical protein